MTNCVNPVTCENMIEADAEIVSLKGQVERLEAQLVTAKEINKNLTAENEKQSTLIKELFDTLAEDEPEPKWFSHPGDYMLMGVVAGVIGAAIYYADQIMGWW